MELRVNINVFIYFCIGENRKDRKSDHGGACDGLRPRRDGEEA